MYSVYYNRGQEGGQVKLWDQEMKRCRAFQLQIGQSVDKHVVVKSVSRIKVQSFHFQNKFHQEVILNIIVYKIHTHVTHSDNSGLLAFACNAWVWG